MTNPHISPNLTTLGRGNVPVAATPNPKPHKTPKIKLFAKIAQYRYQISTLLGASPRKFFSIMGYLSRKPTLPKGLAPCVSTSVIQR
jgi:hypothetical protein